MFFIKNYTIINKKLIYVCAGEYMSLVNTTKNSKENLILERFNNDAMSLRLDPKSLMLNLMMQFSECVERDSLYTKKWKFDNSAFSVALNQEFEDIQMRLYSSTDIDLGD